MSDNTDEKDASKLLAALKAEREAHKATKTALDSTTAELADTAGKLKIAIDATPVNVTEFIAAATKAATAKATAEQQAMIAELQAALETEKRGSADLLGKLQRRTIDEEVRQAATEEHVRPDAIADLLVFAVADLKLSDTGEVVTHDGASVKEWLDGRKSRSPYLWPLSKGAGARGSSHDSMPAYDGNDNPFKAGPGFNLTRAGQILSTDPARAKRLQELAGA